MNFLKGWGKLITRPRIFKTLLLRQARLQVNALAGNIFQVWSDFTAPEMPIEFKPIAILILSQAGGELPNVVAEAECVEEILKAANFNVVRPEKPSLDEVVSRFSGNSVENNRIVLFHFAGHSSPDGISLLSDIAPDSEETFKFLALAEFLKSQQSLRMVFLNGCISEDFRKRFYDDHENDEKVCSIVTSRDINDSTAKIFAERFYHEWLDPNHEVTIKRAFEHVKNWTISNKSDAPDSYRGEALKKAEGSSFPWKINGQVKFTHGHCFDHVFAANIERQKFNPERRIPPVWLPAVLILMFLVAHTALTSAYLSNNSSPAFQASFGYAFTDAEFNSRIKLGTLLDAKEECEQFHFVNAKGERPSKGYYIELFRVFFGLIALYLTYWLLGPFRFPEGWSKLLRFLLLFLPWAGISLFVLHYNLNSAPIGLATEWSNENHWLAAAIPKGEGLRVYNDAYVGDSFSLDTFAYVFEDQRVWRNAGKTNDGFEWADYQAGFLKEIKDATKKATIDSNEEFGKETTKSELFVEAMTNYKKFDQMYRAPYRAYAFYSLVLFGGIAFGVLVCLVFSLRNVYNKIAFLNAARTSAQNLRRYQGPQKVIGNHVFDIMKDSLRRFLAFICLLLGFVMYETSFGFLTLAFNAKLLTIFVLVLLLISLAAAAYIFLGYNEAYRDLELDQKLNVRGPRELLSDPVLIFLWALTISMVGYIITLEPWKFMLS